MTNKVLTFEEARKEWRGEMSVLSARVTNANNEVRTLEAELVRLIKAIVDTQDTQALEELRFAWKDTRQGLDLAGAVRGAPRRQLQHFARLAL